MPRVSLNHGINNSSRQQTESLKTQVQKCASFFNNSINGDSGRTKMLRIIRDANNSLDLFDNASQKYTDEKASEANSLKKAYQRSVTGAVDAIDRRCQQLFTSINSMTLNGQNKKNLSPDQKKSITDSIAVIRADITDLNKMVSGLTDGGPTDDVHGYEFASMMLFDTSFRGPDNRKSARQYYDGFVGADTFKEQLTEANFNRLSKHEMWFASLEKVLDLKVIPAPPNMEARSHDRDLRFEEVESIYGTGGSSRTRGDKSSSRPKAGGSSRAEVADSFFPQAPGIPAAFRRSALRSNSSRGSSDNTHHDSLDAQQGTARVDAQRNVRQSGIMGLANLWDDQQEIRILLTNVAKKIDNADIERLTTWINGSREESNSGNVENRKVATVKILSCIVSTSNTKLDVSGLGLTSLPEGVFKYLTHLEQLNLTNNKLTGQLDVNSLPVSLKRLSLRDNNLTEILNLSHLKNLERLNLSMCGVSALPELSNLTHLDKCWLDQDQEQANRVALKALNQSCEIQILCQESGSRPYKVWQEPVEDNGSRVDDRRTVDSEQGHLDLQDVTIELKNGSPDSDTSNISPHVINHPPHDKRDDVSGSQGTNTDVKPVAEGAVDSFDSVDNSDKSLVNQELRTIEVKIGETRVDEADRDDLYTSEELLQRAVDNMLGEVDVFSTERLSEMGQSYLNQDSETDPESLDLRLKMLGHTLGDPFIKNRTVRGKELEGWRHDIFLAKFAEVLDDQEPFKQDLLYAKALIEKLYSENFTDDQLQTELQQKLDRGKKILMPGGWKGHAVYYEFIPHETGKCSLRVYNTGAGLDYHDAVAIAGDIKFMPYVEYQDIDYNSFQFKLALQQLIILTKTQTIADTSKLSEKQLYESILPAFGGDLKVFTPTEIEDACISKQLAGTCTVSGFKAYLKVAFKDSIGKYEKLFYELEKKYLVESFHQFKLSFHEFKDKERSEQSAQDNLSECNQILSELNFLIEVSKRFLKQSKIAHESELIDQQEYQSTLKTISELNKYTDIFHRELKAFKEANVMHVHELVPQELSESGIFRSPASKQTFTEKIESLNFDSQSQMDPLTAQEPNHGLRLEKFEMEFNGVDDIARFGKYLTFLIVNVSNLINVGTLTKEEAFCIIHRQLQQLPPIEFFNKEFGAGQDKLPAFKNSLLYGMEQLSIFADDQFKSIDCLLIKYKITAIIHALGRNHPTSAAVKSFFFEFYRCGRARKNTF